MVSRTFKPIMHGKHASTNKQSFYREDVKTRSTLPTERKTSNAKHLRSRKTENNSEIQNSKDLDQSLSVSFGKGTIKFNRRARCRCRSRRGNRKWARYIVGSWQAPRHLATSNFLINQSSDGPRTTFFVGRKWPTADLIDHENFPLLLTSSSLSPLHPRIQRWMWTPHTRISLLFSVQTVENLITWYWLSTRILSVTMSKAWKNAEWNFADRGPTAICVAGAITATGAFKKSETSRIFF